MSRVDDNQNTEAPERGKHSVANPFAEAGEEESEKPQLQISNRRAAMFGLSFGVLMVVLLIVCFLLSLALASCTGN